MTGILRSSPFFHLPIFWESVRFLFRPTQTPLASKCSGAAHKICFDTVSCKLFTEIAQSSGPENIDPERLLLGLLAQRSVLSTSRITLENNGKIRPQPDRENAFARANGGEGGIRTHGTREGSTVFETAPFDHSGTSPRSVGGERGGYTAAGRSARGTCEDFRSCSGGDGFRQGQPAVPLSKAAPMAFGGCMP